MSEGNLVFNNAYNVYYEGLCQPHYNAQIHSPQYLFNFQKIHRGKAQVTLYLSHYLEGFHNSLKLLYSWS